MQAQDDALTVRSRLHQIARFAANCLQHLRCQIVSRLKRRSRFSLVICLTVLPILLLAQVDTAWVRIYNGPANLDDSVAAAAVDLNENVYVAGPSNGNSTSWDYVTIKYNSAGAVQWIARYDSPHHDWDVPVGIAVDGAGNVLVAGTSCNVSSYAECLTIKYTPTGETLWVRRYSRPSGQHSVSGLVVDNAGNAYLSGSYLSSTGCRDFLTIKYNPTGDTEWVRTYDSEYNRDDEAKAIALDANRNIYVTGTSCDFFYYTDYLTIKYSQTGEMLWVRRCDGQNGSVDVATSIAVDSVGNAVAGGTTWCSGPRGDFLTVKYGPQGDTTWKRVYDDTLGANAFSVALARSGSVLITGVVWAASADYLTVKYSSTGDTLWTRRYDGPAGRSDRSLAVRLDSAENVYVTGFSEETGEALIG